jgi:hypothetical protein
MLLNLVANFVNPLDLILISPLQEISKMTKLQNTLIMDLVN